MHTPITCPRCGFAQSSFQLELNRQAGLIRTWAAERAYPTQADSLELRHAAAYLDISVGTLQNKASRREIERFRLSGKARFRIAALARYIVEQNSF